MAAYRTAARLFPGLHAPLAGMGMEYARMNNAALAEQLLAAAHAACPRDPLPAHELGCLAFRARALPAAERWLKLALKRIPGRLSPGARRARSRPPTRGRAARRARPSDAPPALQPWGVVRLCVRALPARSRGFSHCNTFRGRVWRATLPYVP